eukprot:CAMPEP_0171903176 /NCGR_PEP_ID=MMETSP0993-20121228/2659_1 /TAXON_ID=483369 /ORGANISM="non described non described, Strain CCMP2098" /LENGTH=59 /DNA_ID=CAMNT_0012533221 /DNA_START=37 /DNA_END=213 /DNA_ORIENTATION=-
MSPFKTATSSIASDAAIAVKKLQEPRAVRRIVGKREVMNSLNTFMWCNAVLLERIFQSK